MDSNDIAGMTKRIKDRFDERSARRHTALVAYAVAGDPDPAVGADILLGIARHADVLEIGVPCARPFRDGPAIAAAHERALAAGSTWKDAVATAGWLRSVGIDIPIVLLLYAEAIKGAGPGPLFQAAAEAGVDGLLIVDFDEEALPWWAPMARMAGLSIVPLVSPSLSKSALQNKLAAAEGIVYCAGASTTGGAAPDPASLAPFLAELRRSTDLPLVLGFGIRTPEIAAEMATLADGLAVGTAFVASIGEALESGGDPAAAASSLSDLFSTALQKGG